jgi:hypothetical protein
MIKVFLTLLFVFCASNSSASLTFTGASTNKVTLTTPFTLGPAIEFTVIMWYMPTRWNAGEGTGNAISDTFVNSFFSADDFFFNIQRATAISEAISTGSAFPQNVWSFVGLTYSEADGCRIFRGTLTSAVAEVPYLSRAVGTGDTQADAGDWWIGNRSAGGANAPGAKIAFFALFDHRMTLGELKAQQFNPHVVSGTKVFLWLGANGTGTQPDWSGNGKNGVVTGATQSANVPLPPPFGR